MTAESVGPLDVLDRAGGWLRSVIAHAVAYPGDGLARGLSDPCRALLGLQCLSQIDALPHAFRSSCARAIDHHQDPASGAFYERSSPDSLHPSDEPLSHDDVRATLLAVQALDALGRRPVSAVSFASAWAAQVTNSITVVDWSDERSAEALTLALALLLHRAEVDGDAHTPAVLHAALDALERAQDPITGLWGADDLAVARRIEAAYRVISVLQYLHRPVPRASRVVDAVLAACPADSGVATLGGDPFAELAAISLLASFADCCREPNDVRRSLLSSIRHLVTMQDDSGVMRTPTERDSHDDVRSTWLRTAALVTIARAPSANFDLAPG